MRVTWDDTRQYTQGAYQGMLYPGDDPGVSWSGLISVTSKGEDSPASSYIDGRRYQNMPAPSSFSGIISAFMYPDEWEPCIGISQGWATAQNRSAFGLSWRDNHELHVVYNALTSPSNDKYQTLSDNPNPLTFSWDFTTLPVNIPGGRPSSHLVIMLDYAQPDALASLEDLLYGNDANDPSLPDPGTVYSIFESHTTVTIVDNGDGTWTATGPDSLIIVTGDSFTIDGAFVTVLDSDNYKIRSL